MSSSSSSFILKLSLPSHAKLGPPTWNENVEEFKCFKCKIRDKMGPMQWRSEGGRGGKDAPGGTCPKGGIFKFTKATLKAAFSVPKSNPRGWHFWYKKATLKAAFSVQKSNPKGGIFDSKKQL